MAARRADRPEDSVTSKFDQRAAIDAPRQLVLRLEQPFNRLQFQIVLKSLERLLQVVFDHGIESGASRYCSNHRPQAGWTAFIPQLDLP